MKTLLIAFGLAGVGYVLYRRFSYHSAETSAQRVTDAEGNVSTVYTKVFDAQYRGTGTGVVETTANKSQIYYQAAVDGGATFRQPSQRTTSLPDADVARIEGTRLVGQTALGIRDPYGVADARGTIRVFRNGAPVDPTAPARTISSQLDARLRQIGFTGYASDTSGAKLAEGWSNALRQVAERFGVSAAVW